VNSPANILFTTAKNRGQHKMLGESYERSTRCGGAWTPFKTLFVNFSAVRAQAFTRARTCRHLWWRSDVRRADSFALRKPQRLQKRCRPGLPTGRAEREARTRAYFHPAASGDAAYIRRAAHAA
jgi:hypothetical protein